MPSILSSGSTSVIEQFSSVSPAENTSTVTIDLAGNTSGALCWALSWQVAYGTGNPEYEGDPIIANTWLNSGDGASQVVEDDSGFGGGTDWRGGVVAGFKVLDGATPADFDITIVAAGRSDTVDTEYLRTGVSAFLTWVIVELGDDYALDLDTADFGDVGSGVFSVRWAGWGASRLNPDEIFGMSGYTTLDLDSSIGDARDGDGGYSPLPSGAPVDIRALWCGTMSAYANLPGSQPIDWNSEGGAQQGWDLAEGDWGINCSLVTYDLVGGGGGELPCTGCPDPAHVPHKRWLFESNKATQAAWHRENWLSVARWAADTAYPTPPPQFHTPNADVTTMDLDNWNALERWGNAWAAECPCWKALLHIPHKITPTAKEEEENWLAFERWTASDCDCAPAPGGE